MDIILFVLMDWGEVMKDISGKTILITGGARGIGLCTAELFAQQNAELIIADINPQALEDAAEKLRALSSRIHTYVVDVSKRDQIEAMAKYIINKFGHLDVLINNAGVGITKEMSDTTLEEWEKQININLWGPLYNIYAFMPSMLKRGKGQIVNVSSGQAFFKVPTWGPYASIKQALGTLSEIMYYELKARGIRVTTVYPFMANTGFYTTIKPQSWGARLAMKLVPYYSHKPQTVAKKIYKAVLKQKRVEMVHILNWIAFYFHFLPILPGIVDRIVFLFLGKERPESIDKNKITCFIRMIREKRLGFQFDEVMSGDHEFESGCGPVGKKKMEFRVTWGPRHFFQWINPFCKKFLVANLEGRVDVEGLCDSVPCRGTLELKYFTERKLRYTFNFEIEGKKYLYIGEKVNLWPWNLHKTHTTCYGKLTETEEDGSKLISQSVTHFRFRTLFQFIFSFRLA